jgi:AGCS family alanine or glycine:cation symporter
MQGLTEFFTTLSGWVWGPPLLILLVGTGIYLTVRLHFLQFTLLPEALMLAFHGKGGADEDVPGDISHFQALMTALAATIGTGNIAGVATDVVLGGPGAIFWMWMTALVGMATKYAEGMLAIIYRVKDKNGNYAGGPMYYLERGLKMKWLAMFFAFFGMVASFGIGNSVQSNSVAQAMQSSFGVAPMTTGWVLLLTTAPVILRGIKSIGRVSSVIVPFMAIGYLLGGFAILATHVDLIKPAFQLILSDAFTGQAMAGGALGSVIRYGVARGVFSNEAGMGSAPIAAAAAKTHIPAHQALVSMTGTFIDTIIVCSMTGLILVMGGQYKDGATGAALTTQSFDSLLPGIGAWVVTIGLIFFAYSTILGWSYYGEKCAEFLFGARCILPFRLIYTVFVLLGSIMSLYLVWAISDALNGLMALPNLVGLLLLSGVVVRETRAYRGGRPSAIDSNSSP